MRAILLKPPRDCVFCTLIAHAFALIAAGRRPGGRVASLADLPHRTPPSTPLFLLIHSPLRAKANTGAQNAQYASFSLQSLQAAQGKLNELLTLVPKDQLQLARDQMAAGY